MKNNKTPTEIEEKILIEVIDKWKNKWEIKEHTKVWWEKMLFEAIQKGFQAGQKQIKDKLLKCKEEAGKLIDIACKSGDNQSWLYHKAQWDLIMNFLEDEDKLSQKEGKEE